MSTKPIAAIYGRVSTDHQDGSIAVQEERCRKYAEMMGFDATEFMDSDTSGAIPIWERENGRKFCDLVNAREKTDTPVAHLVVAKLDRLGRSARDLHNFFHWLDQRKVTLHIMDLSGQICTNQGAGKLIIGVLSMLAEFERDMIRARTQDRINSKFSRQELIGTLPYGWRLKPGTQTLEVHPEEAAAIRRMQTWHREGMGYAAIAGILNRFGTPTKGGKTGGQAWQYQQVKRILHSRHTAALPSEPSTP